MGGMIDINITLLFQLANFLVLMVIMDRLFYRPLLKAMDGRKARVNGLQDDAEKLRTKLEEAKEDYEARWDRERTLAVPIRLEQRAAAYESYRSRLAEAREQANRVLAEELAGLDEVREEAWKELASHIDEASEAMTDDLLPRKRSKGGSE